MLSAAVLGLWGWENINSTTKITYWPKALRLSSTGTSDICCTADLEANSRPVSPQSTIQGTNRIDMKDIRCNYMMGEPHGQRNRCGIVVSQNSKRAVTGPASVGCKKNP